MVRLRPFIEAEREFVQLQVRFKEHLRPMSNKASGDHDAAVRCLESVLRAEQATAPRMMTHLKQASVQQMPDTMLSTLFERLAIGRMAHINKE